jgi:hypothetical protein
MAVAGKTRHVGADLGQDRPHFARVDCQACGAWIDWVKYPEEACGSQILDPRRRTD